MPSTMRPIAGSGLRHDWEVAHVLRHHAGVTTAHQLSRVIAVDWSGKRKGAEETIWQAHVTGDGLVELRNGLGRAALTEELVERFAAEASVVVGLDFSFSFPAAYCRQRGWTSVAEAWAAQPDEIVEAPPFWGRTSTRPAENGDGLRATERDGRLGRPKSIFQIGGAGAVGTGSIRGMPHLLELRRAGFAIWPFDDPMQRPIVVEIYPRAFTGPVRKSRWAERHDALSRHFPALDGAMLERAAGSEDAFDAAFSALAMWEHRAELAALPPRDGDVLLEGEIWRPNGAGS